MFRVNPGTYPATTAGSGGLIKPMTTIVAKIRRFLADESGPAAVEYAVMLMLILLAVITAIQLLGRMTEDYYTENDLLDVLGGDSDGDGGGDDDD